MVWTVNDPACMMEAVRWEVDAILTDVTKTWLDLRAALRGKFASLKFSMNAPNILPSRLRQGLREV